MNQFGVLYSENWFCTINICRNYLIWFIYLFHPKQRSYCVIYSHENYIHEYFWYLLGVDDTVHVKQKD